jgi:NAD dependent epimerase/dehydratase family enzyme
VLARVLHRPAVVPTPIAGLKAVYGSELVDSLLGSQRVSSEKLRASGFTFGHPELEDGLRAALDE